MLGLFAWLSVTLAAAQAAQGASIRISGTARCGPSFGLTCQGSSFGNRCSKYGYCGSRNDYCGDGCQTGWGTCKSGSAPVAQSKISKNGRCGIEGGATCLGSKYGNFCSTSQYGFCGSNTNFCGKGFNPLFGNCSGSPSSIRSRTSPAPSSTKVSSSPNP
ncbi:keratin-associated protein 5-4 [Paraphaeosphaeria sporulosa]